MTDQSIGLQRARHVNASPRGMTRAKSGTLRDFVRRYQHLALPRLLFPMAPRGTIHDARAWANAVRSQQPTDIRRGPPAAFWEVDPPDTRVLPPPRTVAGAVTAAVQRITPIDPTALFMIKDARIVGREGVVISPDNRVFADFTYVDDGPFEGHNIFRRRRFPEITELSGWYATLTYPSSPAYFHWIVESLPRLRMLQPYLRGLDGIFVPDGLEAGLQQSLIAMGVQPTQLIPLGMMSHYRPQHLLVPRYCAGLAVPSWVPQFLKQSVLQEEPATGQPRRRILISRSDAAKRRLLNEDALWPMFADFGFERVRLRDLSFLEQARVFNNAEVVVGAHGAGLANVAFCRPGVKVLELLPSPRVPPHVYYALTHATGGDYWFLNGDARSESPSPADDIHLDFSVDAEALRATLVETLNSPVGAVH